MTYISAFFLFVFYLLVVQEIKTETKPFLTQAQKKCLSLLEDVFLYWGSRLYNSSDEFRAEGIFLRWIEGKRMQKPLE